MSDDNRTELSPSAAGAGGESSQQTIGAVLKQAAVELSEKLEADGCALSRLIGELLINVAWHSPTGRTLFHGRTYLLSDYPLTREVIERDEPRMVRVDDPSADPGEVALLRELGFDSLLMLALEAGDERWGLVEIYRAGDRTFSDDDLALVQGLVADLGRKLDGAQGRSSDSGTQ